MIVEKKSRPAMGLKEFNQILETFQSFGGQECVFSALHGFLLGSGSVSMFHGVDVMARHWHPMWVPKTQEGKISGIALYKEFLDRLQGDKMLPGRGNTLLWYVDDKDHTPVQKQKEQKSRDDKKTAAQDMYPPDVSYEVTEAGILNTDNNRYFKQFKIIEKGLNFVPYDPPRDEKDDETYQEEDLRFPNIHLDGFKARVTYANHEYYYIVSTPWVPLGISLLVAKVNSNHKHNSDHGEESSSYGKISHQRRLQRHRSNKHWLSLDNSPIRANQNESRSRNNSTIDPSTLA